jgi:hypothetical protein
LGEKTTWVLGATLGVEPWRYLRDVLDRLPSHPAERLAELLPGEEARAQRHRGGIVGPGRGNNALPCG